MTRHNACPNPAAGTDLTGWTSSTCTPVRATGLTGLPRTFGVRSTSSGYFRTPVAPCSPGQQFAVSFYMLNNSAAFQFGHTVYIGYTTTGAEAFPETFTSTNTDIGAVSRSSKVSTIASVPSNVTGIFLIIDSMPADIYVTAVMYEPDVSAVDTYFDGSFASCTWDGTAELSASTFTAGPVTKTDGDAVASAESASLTANLSGSDSGGSAEATALNATKTASEAVGVGEAAALVGSRSWRGLEGGSAFVSGGQIEAGSESVNGGQIEGS